MLQIFAKKKKRGFTLIELLVVIAIIGVLASIVLVSMGGARQSARNATRKADMRQIVSAEELYFNASDAFSTAAGPALPSAIGAFMIKTPSDPGTGTPYVWINNTADATKFCAYATLENPVEYYTASHAGNFKSAVVPILAACGF